MILFKDLISENETQIKSYMAWQNYDLNDTLLPVVDLLKDHALKLLSNSYGLFHVEQTILDELCADVFVYFPPLMQQLSISRIMTSESVVQVDILRETMTRTESGNIETEQNSELTVGTTNTDTSVLDSQQKNTGSVIVDNDVTTNQTGEVNIQNVSGIEMTGSRNVAVNHNLPEQAISGITGNLPVDAEGTPILTSAYIQTATENFATANPIDTSETSQQDSLNNSNTQNNTTTTNDVTVAETGTTTRTSTNAGSDNSESLTKTQNNQTVTEVNDREATNAQYAYEVKAFLDSVDAINAFRSWEDKFTWVVGII